MECNVRTLIRDTISDYLDSYCKENDLEPLWGTPEVGFADAGSDYFGKLRELVHPDHYMPDDVLPSARIVVSYFLPTDKEIVRSNISGGRPSPEWAFAYVTSNGIVSGINEAISNKLKELGYQCGTPEDAFRLEGTCVSRWSQRHIAYLAGLGTFGINNMLITNSGCCGRFYSIVTDLDVEPDSPVDIDYCSYKRDGSCGACMSKCGQKALAPGGFDRYSCDRACTENEGIVGADVCGKCMVGMPCSYRNPMAEADNRLGYRK